ncbi:MAG: prepilin-type N-terminal cleavage/methylation domain-containing protein [Candidatus Omnitrophica bacterium]|nr:prepilin-type N-terminal cleavage/methylation domain-containing protein [Candidatus Omnitrophota bacterium]
MGRRGFTLVEVLVSLGLGVALFAAFVSALMGVMYVNGMTRHRMQAAQVVRGEAELLKATAFGFIADRSVELSYDAGADGVFGTSDDLKGTLTVTVRDFLDMDGDGNTAETAVDVDGDGSNDPSAAKPVRLEFSWSERMLGIYRSSSFFVDILIAA